MDYCVNMAVGYAATTFILWNLVVLTLSVRYPLTTVLTFLCFSPILALGVLLMGAFVDCAFERLAQSISLSPALGITIGWTLVGLVIALAPLLSSPPQPSLESLVEASIKVGTETVSNSFLSSDIFYKIGNFTLSLLGIR